jgi:myo-inositol 2-dehydrogenase / D-chiro-inositol 1-dehydrogenase
VGALPTDVLNVGVIGAGRIGRLHAENLARHVPAARLSIVADPFEDAAERCVREVGIGRAVLDYRAVLDEAQVDAVVICSSTDTHAQIIEQAAEAGKHVFCEKPIALSLGTIDRALAAVERAGVKLQVGFNRRFDASFRRARQAVEQGEIGHPWLLHLISRDPAPPPLDYVKVSGGMFLDMTIHDFDMARYLIGSEVEELYARAAVLVDEQIGAAGDVDTAVILLQFANGVIGTIDNSRRAVYGYDQRAEIFGSGGMVSTANAFPNSATISTDQHIRRDLPLHFFLERYRDSYVAELAAFAAAVIHDRPTPVSGLDGRIPIVMGLAAHRSFVEHRPVRLDEIAR